MKIVLDEDDALIVAKAMARSRNLVLDFDSPWGVDSPQDRVYTEALRVIAALSTKHKRD